MRAGVMTSDPRRVPAALPIPHLTFEEATELAFFGAAVLHPLAMQPALQNGRLDVRVKNSYNRRAAEPDTGHPLPTSTRRLSTPLGFDEHECRASDCRSPGVARATTLPACSLGAVWTCHRDTCLAPLHITF